MNWTDLPGPSSFLTRVEQDLRESKSVLAVVPSCFDDRWINEIRSRMEDCYEWRVAPSTPEEFLNEISNRNDGLAFIKPQEIIEAGICRQGFVLTNPPGNTWEKWASFLQNFAELNRGVEDLNRNVFLISTPERTSRLPNQPLLSELYIDGFIRHEDPFFYSAQALEPDETDGLWRRIRMHISSEIAHWDFDLCDQLCELPILSLLDPYDWLRQRGKSRGWHGLSKASDPEILRQLGLVFTVEKNEIMHSVLLALDGNKTEINKRVWIAQVRVLFPIIEEQRIRLIRDLRKIDPATIRAWENEPEIDGDLEIGALSFRMSRSRFSQKLTNYAFRLRKVRNKLAHLQICGTSDIPTDHEWIR